MRLLPIRYDDVRRRAGIPAAAVAAAIAAAWLVPALLSSLETYMFWSRSGRAAPWLAFAVHTPAWLAWAALTPLILHASEAPWLRERTRAAAAALHVTLAIACGAIYGAISAGMWSIIAPNPAGGFTSMFLPWFLSALPLAALAYTGVVVGGRAAYWFARGREAELHSSRLAGQLAAARLDALRMQLHPHFLFNTLNAITVLVRDGERVRAEQALELLSALLRETLGQEPQQLVPLGEEVEFVRRYLAIEQLRFEDRLRTQFNVPQQLEDAQVPAFILQPLIENAIRHGIRDRAQGGTVRVVAAGGAGTLEVRVEDDGAGPAGTPSVGTGVGLANTRERLRVLYGAGATLDLLPLAGGGTCARLRLPLAHAEQDALAQAGQHA